MDFNVRVIQKTLSFGATDEVKSCNVNYTGFISAIVLDIPSFLNDVSVSFSIKNILGHEIVGQSELKKGDNTVFHYPFAYCPTAPDFILSCTLSGQPGGAGGDINVIMYVY
jgi:hypothetical protein